MKFFCDKCKTRYSIGDDRVRGKILKIRCKNCANVITVREGMEAPADDARARPTTGSPPLNTTQPIPSGSVVAPPAPALEEEWYVSIDGVQSGPLSLNDAKKWIGAKPFTAELHCWSEGFDDWLPVDKVSHFRGLRKPLPAPPTRPSGKTAPPPVPKEEKPLFAATMASIERSASQSQKMAAITSPAPSAMKGPTVGSGPIAAKSNGASTGRGSGSAQAIQHKSAGAAALAAAFTAEDPGDSATNIEGMPFPEPPVADPFFSAKSAPTPAAKPDPFAAKKPVVPIHHDDDDNLEIGEVSRVVNLKDIAPRPKPIAKTPTASFDRMNATGGVARISGTASNPRIGGLTGSSPKLSPQELGMNVDSALARPGEPAPDESVVARSFAQRHRRGLFALIGISAVFIAGVVALLIFVVNKDDVEDQTGFGGTRQIDTSRPEDIVRKQLPPAPNAGSNSVTIVKKYIRVPTGGTTGSNTVEEVANGNTLKASDVEDMAAKQGEGTKRCYMRAQKGALGFEIADVKKIAVTLSVNKDGTVKDVQLSEHGADTFGQCLIARIKGWKFRESNGGTFRISLAFSNS